MKHDYMIRTSTRIGDADYPTVSTPLQWIDLTAEVASESPGPGQYLVEAAASLGRLEGGRWGRISKDEPKRGAGRKNAPGPGQYNPTAPRDPRCATFGCSARNTSFSKRGKDAPGPGAYALPNLWMKSDGRTSSRPHPTEEALSQQDDVARKLGKTPEQIYGYRRNASSSLAGAAWGKLAKHSDPYKDFRTPGAGPGSTCIPPPPEIVGGKISRSKITRYSDTLGGGGKATPSPLSYHAESVDMYNTKFKKYIGNSKWSATGTERFKDLRSLETPGPGSYTPSYPADRHVNGVVLRSETPSLKQYRSPFVLKTSIRRPRSTPPVFSLEGRESKAKSLKPADGSETGRSSSTLASEKKEIVRKKSPVKKRGASLWVSKND